MKKFNLSKKDVKGKEKTVTMRITGDVDDINEIGNALSEQGFTFNDNFKLYEDDKNEGTYHLYLYDIKKPES